MSIIKFTDLDLPKLKQEKHGDDTFISYFVSAEYYPSAFPMWIDLLDGNHKIPIQLPRAFKKTKEGDEIIIEKMTSSNPIIQKNLFAKRQIRATDFYKKREIREFVIDLKGTIWEIRSGNAERLEKEPEVYISQQEKLSVVRDEVSKVKAIQEMSVEELERILAKKKQQTEKESIVIDGKTQKVEKTETKKNQSRSEKMKEYWAKKKSKI